jgi:hypothetical protein
MRLPLEEDRWSGADSQCLAKLEEKKQVLRFEKNDKQRVSAGSA